MSLQMVGCNLHSKRQSYCSLLAMLWNMDYGMMSGSKTSKLELRGKLGIRLLLFTLSKNNKTSKS